MPFFIYVLVQYRPTGSHLFPYTTLFRSGGDRIEGECGTALLARGHDAERLTYNAEDRKREQSAHKDQRQQPLVTDVRHRSEEHTSELQSPCNLVCRLLLEKKNKKEQKHL